MGEIRTPEEMREEAVEICKKYASCEGIAQKIEAEIAAIPVAPREVPPEVRGLALARRFHEAYERLAPSFGYETRLETRTFDPESKNGRLMVAVCAELFPEPATPTEYRAEVYEAAVALIAAEDMPPHTPFEGNSPEWDMKFNAEHAARKALRAAVARVQEGT